MKHVVCAASPGSGSLGHGLRRCVLVTAFGAFPGARTNPTAAILTRLGRHRGRLARLGIELRCLLLPVVYDEIEPALQLAADLHGPEAVLHLGLAGRRRTLSVEMRALNRAGPLHPDAKGRRPQRTVLVAGAPQSLAATYPAAEIFVAVRRSGVAARGSIDAGDYVCNATLFASLAGHIAPHVGFLHVPKVRRTQSRGEAGRPTIDDLTKAVLAAIIVIGRRYGLSRGRGGAPRALQRDDVPGIRSPIRRGPAAGHRVA